MDAINERRKRHLRILEAALKEQVVDVQIVLGICVQISRQAFCNELTEYFACLQEYVGANQNQFQQHDVLAIPLIKKKLGTLKSSLRVQIHSVKKLDKMFWLLFEQNSEVSRAIQNYKDKYVKTQECDKPNANVLTQQNKVNSNFRMKLHHIIRQNSKSQKDSIRYSFSVQSSHNPSSQTPIQASRNSLQIDQNALSRRHMTKRLQSLN